MRTKKYLVIFILPYQYIIGMNQEVRAMMKTRAKQTVLFFAETEMTNILASEPSFFDSFDSILIFKGVQLSEM